MKDNWYQFHIWGKWELMACGPIHINNKKKKEIKAELETKR